MYINLEGMNLCCEDSISILTLLIDTGRQTRAVYLVDIHILGARVFNNTGKKVKLVTLKYVLQDNKISKVFNQQTIHGDIVQYCVGDVQYLPGLWHWFWKYSGYFVRRALV
jgi:hypothetical protein